MTCCSLASLSICILFCRCLTTDSLPRGYPGQLFGLRRMLEVDGERRDSRFILVWALDRDRVIALRPVSVSLLRWIDCVVLSLLQGCLHHLFISVEMDVVRLDRQVYSYYLRSSSREPCSPLYSLGGRSPSRLRSRIPNRITYI
jgi:hypothetical protein